ncbi:MAG: hypothetical protein AB7U82_12180 [Blastocatellales bacterium]
MRKTIFSGVLIGAGLLLGACGANSTTATTAPSPTPAVASTSTPIASARTVTGTNTIENKDGSTTVVTHYSDGSKTEARTFKSGRLSTVTRETSAAGARTARVTYRADSKEVEVKDPSWVDKSMDATGNALVEAADKAEDVGDATKKGAREVADKAEDVGDAAKQGARKAEDKAKDAGSAIKKGAKKGANETADKAEDVGDAMKKGAKKAGSKIKDIVKPD